MIIESILNLVKAFLLFLIGLFPKLPDFVDSGGYLDKLAEVVSYADIFCDLKVVLANLLLCFVCSNIRFIWGAIMWVVRKIPGVN